MIRATTRIRSAAEVLLLICALEFGTWVLGPLVVRDHAYIPLYWLLVLVCGAYVLWLSPMVINRDLADMRGWAWRGEPRSGQGQWRQSWWWYAGFTLVIGIALIVAGWWRDPGVWHRIVPATFAVRLSGYLVWGSVQALIFFGFVHTRCRKAIPLPAGPMGPYQHQAMVGMATALVFAGVHFPNWPLMGFALAAGLVWSWLFYWRPNVWLLGFCHALLGTLLHQFIRIPMRIGPFYSEQHGYIMRTVVPGLADFIGQRF